MKAVLWSSPVGWMEWSGVSRTWPNPTCRAKAITALCRAGPPQGSLTGQVSPTLRPAQRRPKLLWTECSAAPRRSLGEIAKVPAPAGGGHERAGGGADGRGGGEGGKGEASRRRAASPSEDAKPRRSFRRRPNLQWSLWSGFSASVEVILWIV